MESLTVTIDFPKGPSGQNKRGHWAASSGKTKAARRKTRLQVASEIAGRKWDAAAMEVRLFFPDRRRRDTFNVIEHLKPHIDGITDAGLIDDDDWTRLIPTIAIPQMDRDNPRIELVLTPTERL
jgi:Holliday junction resolvase RusA-like endonuclease